MTHSEGLSQQNSSLRARLRFALLIVIAALAVPAVRAQSGALGGALAGALDGPQWDEFQYTLDLQRMFRNDPTRRAPKFNSNDAFAAAPTQWTSYPLGNQATYSVPLGPVTLRFSGANVRMVDGSFLNKSGNVQTRVPSNRLVAASGWATAVALPRPTVEPFNYNVPVGYQMTWIKGYLTREVVMTNYQRSLPGGQCPHKTAWYVYRYLYHAPNGTVVQFFERPAETSRMSTWASTCGSTPVTGGEPTFYWSTSGNASLDTSNKCTPVIHWADGSTEEFDNSIAPSNPDQDTDIMSPPYRPPCTAADLDRDRRLIDRNGNITRFRGAGATQTMTDSLGRKTVLTFDSAPSGLLRLLTVETPSIGNAPSFLYTIAWRTLDISFAAIWPDIQCRQDGTGFAYTCPPSKIDLIDSITLPDGRSYRFYYGAWGNLEYVFEPGGAVRQYVYGGLPITPYANASVALNNRLETCQQNLVTDPPCQLWSGLEVNMQARGMIAERVWPNGCGSSTPAGCNAAYFETKYDLALTKLALSSCTFDSVGAATGTSPLGCSQVWKTTTLPDGSVTKSGMAVRALPATGRPNESCSKGVAADPHGWSIGDEVWSGSTLLSANYQGDKNTGDLFYDFDVVQACLTPFATTANVRASKSISFRDGLNTTANSVYGNAVDIDPDPAKAEIRNIGGPTSVCLFSGVVSEAGCSPAGATPLTRTDATYANYFPGTFGGTNLLGLTTSKRFYGTTADGTAFSPTALTESTYGYDEFPVTASGLPGSVLDGSAGLAAGSQRGNLTSATSRIDSTRTVTTQTKYYDNGETQSLTDGMGGTVTIAPAFALCSSSSTLSKTAIDAAGKSSTVKVDCLSGKALQTLDANGQSTYMQYDFLGRVVETAGPGDVLTALPTGGAQPFTRDLGAPTGAGSVAGEAQVTSWTEYLSRGVPGQQREVSHIRDGSAGGLYTKVFDDGLGRAVQTRTKVDPSKSGGFAELVSTIVYDGMGRTPAQFAPCFAAAGDVQTANCGKTLSTTTYDALGRPLSVTTAGDRKTTYQYGLSGDGRWLLTTVNPKSYTTKTYRNLLGQTVQVDRQAARCGGFCTTKFKYDAAGRLLTITDPLGNKVEQEYDGLGRRTKMIDPDMGTWSYEYDANNNLTKQTDGKGQVIVFTYDKLNRLTVKDLPPTRASVNDPPGPEDVTYFYDGTGPQPPAETVPVNDAAFVGQSVPSSMTAGQIVEVTVTMQNTGTTTWTAAQLYRLGSQNPQDNTLWRDGRVELPSSVAPGAQVTFRFNITAPSAPATYKFQWRMLRESVEWFGALTPETNIIVSPATPAPTVSAISPASGATAGGTSVTISGTAFASGATVTFDGTAATSVSVVSATSITAATPTHTAGSVDVIVRNPDNQSGILLSGFTYRVPAPTVSSIAPASGTTAGGTSVTISGTGFAIGTTVTIGGAAASVTGLSTTSITATTPAHAAGAVDVVVRNADAQTGTLPSGFTYVTPTPAPAVSAISPASGTTAGGTSVTITGTGFSSGATVTLGGTAATSVSVVNATTITATTPAHAAGAVDVVVRNADAQTGTRTSGFTYVAPPPAPTVSAISPASGTTAGGTSVTITGTGFSSGATVTLGGTAATSVSVVNATTITATTPAHAAGAVDVVVRNADAQTGTRPSGFTYVAPPPAPTVSAISPASGTTAGGTSVTISGTGFSSGATVTLGGTAATGVSVLSATSITATTPAHAAGGADVVVRNPDTQTGTLPGGFTYITPAAALAGISPSSVQAGSAGLILTVSGSNFVSGAVVKLNNSDRPTTFVSSTQLTAQLSTADLQSAGSVSITAANPGGGVTGGLALNIFAIKSIYRASVDFSSVQGQNNWRYLDSNGTPLTWDAANNWWSGNFALLWGAGGHPSNNVDAMRQWRAPAPGTIRITGTASDGDPGGGDGVVVSIRKGTTVLWQQAIANGNTTGFAYDLTTTVVAGDTINFLINRNAESTYDSTNFDPTIVLSPTYKASADFSSVQGQNNWSYLDSNGTPLTWDAANNWWSGNFALLWGAGGHPSNNVDAMRQWRAPAPGTIRITGTASDGDPGGGDGVVVSIRKGTTVLWQQAVANGNTTGFAYDLTTTVVAGDTINFLINRNAESTYDSTNFDPTISFSPAAKASSDFSTLQGQNNWSYLDSNGAAMSFDAANNYWKGAEQFLLLWNTGGHPGNTVDSVRQWRAPGAGSVRITGNASDNNPGGGDGVVVSIKKGTTVLWQQTILNADATGFSYDLTTPVAPGDAISFVINKRGDWNFDGTNFDPTIGYIAPAPAPTVSGISPASGTTAGGTSVTIAGTGFASGATVTIGGTAATSVSVVSATSITAVAPAHAAGAVDVTVRNADAQSGTLPNGFTYTAPPSSTTPVGYWKFDDGAGSTTAADSSGNGATGALINSPAWTTGKLGGALSFNGTNYVSIPNTPSWNVASSKYTVAFWVKVNEIKDFAAPIAVGNWGTGALEIWSMANGWNFKIRTSGGPNNWPCDGLSSALGYLTAVDNTFHHVAVVMDAAASRCSMYSDGTLVGTDTYVDGVTSLGTQSLNIGGFGDAARLASVIDDVRIYNTALTQSEVQALANAGTDTTPPIVTISSPLGGATVAGTITVSANASDNIGVAGVQFKLDGASLGAEDTTAPYSTTWNTTSSSNGSHTLTAVARDAAGNTATSLGVTVTVSNAAPAPTVSAVSPTSGTTAGGTAVTITGTGFASGATVTIGGTAATSVSVVSATSIAAVTPAHAAGAGDVVVRNADGQSGTLPGGFTYVAPPAGPTPIAYWKLDDGGGSTTAADSSGNGATGTLINSPVWMIGRLGGALGFNGNNYVSIPNRPSWNVASSKYTVAFWVKVNEIKDYAGAVAIGNWGTGALEITTMANRWTFHIGTSGGPNGWQCDEISSPLGYLTTVDNTFHHVAVVMDSAASRCSIYSDGALVGTDTYVDGVTSFGTLSLNIGGFADANRLGSVIDDVRLYNTALTQAQVQSLANGNP